MSPIKPQDLRTLIQFTLKPINLYSANVEELLMATCANESNLGEYRTQAPHGPARGIFQMEGEDFNDIWINYLDYHEGLSEQVKSFNSGNQGTVDDLINNDPYAIVMCRIHYLRKPGNLPDPNDIDVIWAYYKKYYNSMKGAATQDVFVEKYKKYVLQQ